MEFVSLERLLRGRRLAGGAFHPAGRQGNNRAETILVGGMLLGLAVFGAAFATNPRVAIVWISIALGGLAASAPVGWSLPGLVPPKGSVGTVGGIMNFGNNLMGAVAPAVTGIIVGATNSFANAFITAGGILLIGILCYLFLLGRIEPIPEPPAVNVP